MALFAHPLARVQRCPIAAAPVPSGRGFPLASLTGARRKPFAGGAMHKFFIAAAAALVCSLAALARADVLLTLQKSLDNGIGSADSPVDLVGPFEFTYELSGTTQNQAPPPAGSPYLFEDIVFSDATVGQTFRATPESDPDFAALARLITNGANDNAFSRRTFFDRSHVGVQSIAELGATQPERFFYFDRKVGQPVDFAGATLTAISLRNDAFNVAVDPNGKSGRVTGSMTIIVEGVVPEPATAAIVALPVVALLLRRPTAAARRRA
jgi:hypothetical protein